MAHYMVESPHTPEECLRALDEIRASGQDHLSAYEWGCAAGVHTGWANVDAKNESEAKEYVPEFLRKKARVVPVSKVTPEDIESLHKQKAN